MRVWLCAVCLVVACGGKKKQKRGGDAAPVIIVPTPLFDGGAPGTAADEVEPNDSADVATALAIGGSARGKIDPDNDVDFYRVEVPEAGALTVLTNMVDADLTVDIEDAGGTNLAKSDRGATRVREGVPNLSVAPGRYTVVVRKKQQPPPKKRPKKGAPVPPPAPTTPVSYEVTATLAPFAPNAEREPDDDRGTANDLIVGDTVQGHVGWMGDVDFWKLSVEMLSEKNSIDIEVGNIDGVALTLELADGVGQSLLVRKVPKGSPLVVKNVRASVPSGAPPFHYVSIKADRTQSNPESHYTLRVVGNPIELDEEAEPNDTLEKPGAFPTDRTRVAGEWTAGDVDCYALAADTNPQTLDITLVPAEVDLSLEIFVDGKVVAKSEVAGKDATEKVTATVPPSAKAIVRVRPAKADAAGQGSYELTIKEGNAGG